MCVIYIDSQNKCQCQIHQLFYENMNRSTNLLLYKDFKLLKTASFFFAFRLLAMLLRLGSRFGALGSGFDTDAPVSLVTLHVIRVDIALLGEGQTL